MQIYNRIRRQSLATPLYTHSLSDVCVMFY